MNRQLSRWLMDKLTNSRLVKILRMDETEWLGKIWWIEKTQNWRNFDEKVWLNTIDEILMNRWDSGLMKNRLGKTHEKWRKYNKQELLTKLREIGKTEKMCQNLVNRRNSGEQVRRMMVDRNMNEWDTDDWRKSDQYTRLETTNEFLLE